MARKLLLLNGLAILGVVLNHSVAQSFVAMFWWTDRYLPVQVPNFDQLGGVSYYVLRLVEQLVSYSVPSFLFVSGFFVSLAGVGSDSKQWGVVWKRCLSLAIPYVVWSVFAVTAGMLQGIAPTPARIVRGLLLGRAADHYYFIPLLIQLYLLSPLLVVFAKRSWKLLLLSAALVQVLPRSLDYLVVLGIDSTVVHRLLEWRPTCLFVNKVFWFALGIVAMQHLQPFTRWLSRTKRAWLTAWFLLVVAGYVEWETLFHLSRQPWIAYFDTLCDALCAGAFILAFLGFGTPNIPFAKKLSDLGTRSFGIYLSHGVALAAAAKATYHIAPAVLAYQSLYFPMLVVAGVAAPVLLMYLVHKTSPKRLYASLFG